MELGSLCARATWASVVSKREDGRCWRCAGNGHSGGESGAEQPSEEQEPATPDGPAAAIRGRMQSNVTHFGCGLGSLLEKMSLHVQIREHSAQSMQRKNGMGNIGCFALAGLAVTSAGSTPL